MCEERQKEKEILREDNGKEIGFKSEIDGGKENK